MYSSVWNERFAGNVTRAADCIVVVQFWVCELLKEKLWNFKTSGSVYVSGEMIRVHIS